VEGGVRAPPSTPVILFCLILVGAAVDVSAAAGAGFSASTAPQQLVHAYPLGPKRLCCHGPSGSSRRSLLSGQSGSTPAAGSVQQRTRSDDQGGSGGSKSGSWSVMLLGLGALGALLPVAVVGAISRTRRHRARTASRAAGVGQTAAAQPAGAAGPAAAERPGEEPTELAYRRADSAGDADGAFNLGVLLHARRHIAGAIAAYERAEHRGDPDAGFNLGVLLYEIGDLDGAQDAWRRCVERGHPKAAANLVFLLERRGELPPREPAAPGARHADPARDIRGDFNLGVLLHKRRDFGGATAAYRRAELSGDSDAGFNLGVLLYEAGDFDGAEAAWRRSIEQGHPKAEANLGFLLSRRGHLEGSRIVGSNRAPDLRHWTAPHQT
jgi:TPR repeat protein